MQPREPEHHRHLAELNRLADELFAVVRDEFGGTDPLVVHLDRSDRLMSVRMDLPALVNATLLTAQLLRRATATPSAAHPRCVVGLADLMDLLIPSLLERRSCGASTDGVLRRLQARMDSIAMSLALLADPGAPEYG